MVVSNRLGSPRVRARRGRGPTLTMIRTVGGEVFGGYTRVSWSSRNSFVPSPQGGTFVFALSSLYSKQTPAKFELRGSHRNTAIYDRAGNGPSFGYGDIFVVGLPYGNAVVQAPSCFFSSAPRGMLPKFMLLDYPPRAPPPVIVTAEATEPTLAHAPAECQMAHRLRDTVPAH